MHEARWSIPNRGQRTMAGRIKSAAVAALRVTPFPILPCGVMQIGRYRASIAPHRIRYFERDWIICRVENETFDASGGPENLDELLAYFLDHVRG
jgi:hypothetical protein